MTDTGAWQRTSPLAALFFLARLIRIIAKNAWQALAPLAALLFASQGNLFDKLAFVATAAVIGSIAFSVLQYWFFRFRITPDAVLIREGVFRKKQTDIKFRRIQGINTAQNVIYRPLGLVNVSFDTAGSSGSEGALPAVRNALAAELHSRIAERRRVVVETGDAAPAADERGEPLLQLDWRDMFRIGLSDRRVLVVLAVLGPLFEQMGDETEQLIDAYAARAVAALAALDRATGALVIIGLVLAVATLLATASVAAAFLRFHRFRLTEQNGRLETVGGLLTRHTNAMDISKIQVLRLQQGALLRAFGRFRAVLRQATSSGKQAEGKSMVLPIIRPQFVPTLTGVAFEPGTMGLDLDPRSGRFRRISPYYLRPRIALFGLLPAVAGTLFAWPSLGVGSFALLLWVPAVAGIAYLVWRRFGVQFDEESLVHRSGFIGFRLDAFLFRKAQRVTVSQSWLQRRRGLGGLHIHLASGSVRLRYIDYALACALRDHILFKVESSDRSWF